MYGIAIHVSIRSSINLGYSMLIYWINPTRMVFKIIKAAVATISEVRILYIRRWRLDVDPLSDLSVNFYILTHALIYKMAVRVSPLQKPNIDHSSVHYFRLDRSLF